MLANHRKLLFLNESTSLAPQPPDKTMAKICNDCNFYDAEGEESVCPQCGTMMQITMLAPANADPIQMAAEQETWENEPVQYEVLEQPAGMRMSQIGTGIAIYFVVWRFGSRFLEFCFGHVLYETDMQTGMLVAAGILLALYVVAALTAGVVAGAWTVNWIPQGIGVGGGIFFLPILLLLLFWPESLGYFFIIVGITTAISVIGAWVGHKMIPASRIPIY